MTTLPVDIVGGTEDHPGIHNATNAQVNTNTASITSLGTSVTGKADDTGVVHKATTETVTGDKDFTGAMTHNSHAVVDTTDSRLTDTRTPAAGSVGDTQVSAISESKITNLTTDLAAKALKVTPQSLVTASTATLAANTLNAFDTTSNAITATLPSAPADGTEISIKLVIKGAGHALTVNCGGSDVFNKSGGGTAAVINTVSEALCLKYAASGAIWYLFAEDPPVIGERLLGDSGGEATLVRSSVAGNSVGTSSQQLKVTYFTAQRTEVISQMGVYIGTAAAGATPTLSRFVVFDASDDGTLNSIVASTVNDTALLTGSTAAYHGKALSSSFTKYRGKRYAAGMLCVTGAATPTFGGAFLGVTVDAGKQQRWAGNVASQSDLPSSVVAGSVTDSSSAIQFILLP